MNMGNFNSDNYYECIIIGGGASGLMLAAGLDLKGAREERREILSMLTAKQDRFSADVSTGTAMPNWRNGWKTTALLWQMKGAIM